ncbi:histidine phosphatase family protein [Dermacoccaceae bacterium W4C1]
MIWRHGQTTHNASGRWQGQLDTELSELGREQAARAATALAELKPAALYCSDLRRAADTAAALAAVTGLVPQADPRLREIHVGQWQGLTGAEVDERYPGLLEALARGDDPVRGETGESVAQVAVRARAALADITAATEPGQTIVIATHGVTGRTLAAELAGIDQRVAWISLAGLHNCHWAELVDHRFGWRIDRWNAGVQEAQR